MFGYEVLAKDKPVMSAVPLKYTDYSIQLSRRLSALNPRIERYTFLFENLNNFVFPEHLFPDAFHRAHVPPVQQKNKPICD